MRYKQEKAPCTVLLILANIIVFFVLTAKGMTEDAEFMLGHGAMYVPYIIIVENTIDCLRACLCILDSIILRIIW